MPLSTDIQDREFDKFQLNGSGLTAVRTVTEGTLTGEIRPSGLNVGGLVTEVTLNSSTWTAIPATPLANRNALAIQNLSGIEIKVNYSSGISGYVGMVVGDGAERTYDITDSIIIYGKCQSGTATVNVEEIA